jgi:hypothetical protein
MPHQPPRRVSEQLEIFPRAVRVEALDPQLHVGANTRVQALYRVRFSDEARPHLVFRDRYGLYCEEHGKTCEAVRAVVEQSSAA